MSYISRIKMRIVGKMWDRRDFANAMTGIGEYIVGDGIEITDVLSDNDDYEDIAGLVSVSAISSLITEPDYGSYKYWSKMFSSTRKQLNLVVACAFFNVDAEIYCTNEFNGVEEHILVKDGDLKVCEFGDYEFVLFNQFETYGKFIECCPHLAATTSEEQFERFVDPPVDDDEDGYMEYHEFDNLEFTIPDEKGTSVKTSKSEDKGEKYTPINDSKEDPVNHPNHYETGKYECIDVMEEALGRVIVEDFCIANTFKYIYRFMKKNGTEDVKKAKWYLDRFIKMTEEDKKHEIY